MRIILNVIWLVLCGIWMSIAYALAGLLCFGTLLRSSELLQHRALFIRRQPNLPPAA